MPSLLSQLTSGTFPTDRTEFFRAHIRPDGHAWSFAGHEYLEAIVADTSREIVLRKAAQLGLSTWAMGVLLHDCSQGRSAGYYLSDRDFMRAFVQDKFDPLCNADEALASITMEGQASEGVAAAARARRKSADNLRIKKIGHGTAWFQGLQKLKDAKSISLDTIIKDELNELDPQFVPWLADRLLHSSYKHMISLSQCSVPEYGIDAEFLASDQKFFLLQCARCRRWCNLIEDWPDCLVEHHPGPARAGRRLSPPSSPARKRPQGGRAQGEGGRGGEDAVGAGGVRQTSDHRIVCRKCGARISIPTARAYEWVAKAPGRPVSGYALSQLYGPFCEAADVAARVAKAERSLPELNSLMVSVVGLPFAGDKQPLSDDVLSAACRDWPIGPPAVLDKAIPQAHRQRPLRLAGIDQGALLHAVASQVDEAGKRLTFDIREFRGDDKWAQLARWLLEQGITFFVIDAQPERTEVNRLLRTDGLHGAMCFFPEGANDLRVSIMEPEHARPMKAVNYRRTEAIDEMTGEMKSGNILLPSPRVEILGALKSHCKRLVKALNPQTGRNEYVKGVENHFGLALTYMHLAGRVAEMLHIGPAEPFGSAESHLVGTPLAPNRKMVY